MSDLETYLYDHLSGSNFAVGLLEFVRDQHAGEPLSDSAAVLLAEIEQDRNTLQGIIGRVSDGTPILKEAAAWLGEKMSEFKLRQGYFGTFEALEALAVGIQGKLALWRALEIIAGVDARLQGLDFNQLADSAQRQHSQAEELRLQSALAAFASTENVAVLLVPERVDGVQSARPQRRKPNRQQRNRAQHNRNGSESHGVSNIHAE
jgi:hypothetical protein